MVHLPSSNVELRARVKLLMSKFETHIDIDINSTRQSQPVWSSLEEESTILIREKRFHLHRWNQTSFAEVVSKARTITRRRGYNFLYFPSIFLWTATWDLTNKLDLFQGTYILRSVSSNRKQLSWWSSRLDEVWLAFLGQIPSIHNQLQASEAWEKVNKRVIAIVFTGWEDLIYGCPPRSDMRRLWRFDFSLVSHRDSRSIKSRMFKFG